MSRPPRWPWVVAVAITVAVVASCARTGPNSEVGPRGLDRDLEVVDQALRTARAKAHLSARRQTATEIVHAALGLGLDAPIAIPESSRVLSLADFFRQVARDASGPIFLCEGDDVLARRSLHESDAEKHPDQFLAYLAQMGLPLGAQLKVEDRSATLADLVESARRRFDPAQEVTYTLTALAILTPASARWHDRLGRESSLADLAALELRSDPSHLACGGTHSLFALASALQRAQQSHQADLPPWPQVAGRLAERLHAIRAEQEADGNFPLRLVSDSPNGDDTPRARIYSTGHTLEWVLRALPDGDLQAEWVRKAVRSLSSAILENATDPPPATPWYHALHALQMYRDRVGKRGAGIRPDPQATASDSTSHQP